MRLTFLVVVLSICSSAYAQTPIIAVCDRGDVETKSFRIDGPATLTIDAISEERDYDRAYGVSVYLAKSSDDEINVEEIWELELGDKKRTSGKDNFRVRVKPGVYFFQVHTVLDGVWSIKLHHDNQVDAYSYRKAGRHCEILFDGQVVATAIDEKMAKKITNLLNASNQ